MGFPSIFSKISSRLQPVYDVAQFGEDLIFNFPFVNAGNRIIRPDGTTTEPLVPSSEYRTPNATIERGLAAAESHSWKTIIDMPAWVFGAAFQVAANSPLGSTLQVSITYAPPGEIAQNIVAPFSFTVPASALAATKQLVHDIAAIAFLPQHSVITLTLTNTGANAILLESIANTDPTIPGETWANYLKIHLHPHLNHADYIFGTERAS